MEIHTCEYEISLFLLASQSDFWSSLTNSLDKCLWSVGCLPGTVLGIRIQCQKQPLS